MTQEKNGGNGRGSRGIEMAEKGGNPGDEDGNRGEEERLAGRGKGETVEDAADGFEGQDDKILGSGG